MGTFFVVFRGKTFLKISGFCGRFDGFFFEDYNSLSISFSTNLFLLIYLFKQPIGVLKKLKHFIKIF